MALGRAYILILSYQIAGSVTSFDASPTFCASSASSMHVINSLLCSLLHNLCANVTRTRNTPVTSIEALKQQTVDGSDAPDAATKFDMLMQHCLLELT
jgi:hypothetical protein